MEDGKTVITVVCTGNVCRSPMAKHLLQHALDADNSGLEGFIVRSAGLSAFTGDPASANAVRAMGKVGLDISGHRSQTFSDQVMEVSDLVLTMTSGHKEIIQRLYPDSPVPVHRFREWILDGSREVPDPFGGSLEVYLETRDSLAEAIPSVLKFIKDHFKQ